MTDNVSGKVTGYVTYDDWGAPTAKANLKLGLRELDLVTEYTGHPYDQVLGMYFAEARMYDAEDRKFVAVDPFRGILTRPESLTKYSYCCNNPLIMTDPDGFSPVAVRTTDTGGYNSLETYYYTLTCGDTYATGRNETITYYTKSVVIRLVDKVNGSCFLTLSKNGALLYGGNQGDFNEEPYSQYTSGSGSCGVIAAANVIAYMAKRNYKGISSGKLMSQYAYNKDNQIYHSSYMGMAFNIYMNFLTPKDFDKIYLVYYKGIKVTVSQVIGEVVKELNESGNKSIANMINNITTVGIWSIDKVTNAILKYSQDKGVSLLSKSTSNYDRGRSGSFERGCEFIHEGLLKDCPVIIYLTVNPSADATAIADKHFMVITQLVRVYSLSQKTKNGIKYPINEELDYAYITVASWGQEYVINFDRIWNDSFMDNVAGLLKLTKRHQCLELVLIIKFRGVILHMYIKQLKRIAILLFSLLICSACNRLPTPSSFNDFSAKIKDDYNFIRAFFFSAPEAQTFLSN